MKSKARFKTLQKQKGGPYYFQFINQEAKAVLESQIYKDREGALAGLRKLRQLAKDPSRYKIEKNKNSYRFQIRAMNHKTMASSIDFASKKELDATLKLLQQSPAKRRRPKSVKAKTPSKAKSMVPSQLSKEKQTDLGRYNFAVTFYLPEKGANLVGKVVFPLTEDKLSFKGMDMDKISAFFQEHLPNFEKEKLSRPKSKRAAGKSSPKKPKPHKKTQPRPQINRISMGLELNVIGHEDQGINTRSLIELKMQLPENKVKAKDQFFLASIYAKSLEDGVKILLAGNFKGKIEAQSRYLTIPLALSNFQFKSGLHRFSCAVQLFNSGQQLIQEEILEGMHFVNIVQEKLLELSLA